jgi:type IV pilus assembly protein PilY1
MKKPTSTPDQKASRHQAAWRVVAAMLLAVLLPLATGGRAGTLADQPLSAQTGIPPNVLFALSVEFPTANTAAYQGSDDYSDNNEYLGYFDQDKCYGYEAANGWFAPTGAATAHDCNNAWSGNFLNWVSMTGLDEFRFAMTGGNRAVDNATATVLERSFQSGQGGTSNFPDKTWTEDGTSTTYPNGTRLTIKNQGKGVQMVVYPNGADVANCENPTLTGGTFRCGSVTLASDGTVGTCTATAGSGTDSAPYRCSSFGPFGDVTPSSSAGSATSTATATVNTTVTCTSPDFAQTPFHCTLTMAGGATGTCNSWQGNGGATTPWTCGDFKKFSNGKSFSQASTGNTTSTFSSVVTGAQASETVSCSVSAGPLVSCTMANGDLATCTAFDSESPHTCTAFSFTTGDVASTKAVYASSARSATHASTVRREDYYDRYTISYKPLSTQTVYYVSSYSGSNVAGYTYVSAYNLAFGTTATLNVRVKVCDEAQGLEENCKKYGSSWKPTGVVQDNADQMRFGVMSYFKADDHDNAILRARMKTVAPFATAPTGVVANPLREWSAADGTLFSNPDSADADATWGAGRLTSSGVVNYINRFGKTAAGYKTYDDVGKLYYEALRYLRGLSPTTDFNNGATQANSDGFPVIKSWTDPVTNSCQKNYIVVMGDTHTWCDRRLPGGAYTNTPSPVCDTYRDDNGNPHVADKGALAGDSIDVTALTNTVGTLEGMTTLATSPSSYFNTGGTGMAGLAYWAASRDFRPTMDGDQRVQTMVIDVQEYRDCGYQSPFWLAAKYGTPGSYNADQSWKTSDNPAMGPLSLPASGCSLDVRTNRPPGYNNAGGVVQWPRSLLRGGDPASMISSVRGALATITAMATSDSALGQSAGTLDNGIGAFIYSASYKTSGWQGELQALPVDTRGNVSTSGGWLASSKLPTASNRNIYSFNDGAAADGTAETGGAARRGFAFTSSNFTSALSGRQQAALNRDETGAVDTLGADRINWLRGDRSKEISADSSDAANAAGGRLWRMRQSLLGDIVNSNPVFVGAPTDVTGSRDFALQNASRTPAVYVGANDGMLHAFNASSTVGAAGQLQNTPDSGKELFAYVPAGVYRNLSRLMSPSYTHKYFVDGTPVVADACLGNSAGAACTGAASWKTVLVGGLNAGGQGIYALDVTNPAAFNETRVLWEFTDRDDPELGATFGAPLVRKLNNQKWAVIFGSGYNNTTADGSASSTGRAAIFILYADGPGVGQRWVLNTNYFKIVLPSPSDVNATLPLTPPNGISSLIDVDRDNSGTVDLLYAGDRRGNLWKIDLSGGIAPSATATTWRSALNPNGVAVPLFTAVSATGDAQQITRGMEVVRHPRGGFMVLFGTGAWVDTEDLMSASHDSFYGIWDSDDGSLVTRASLQKQKVVANVTSAGAACIAGAADCFAVMSNCTPQYASATQSVTALCPADIATTTAAQQRGWVFDFPGGGERIRSSAPLINGRLVTFTTLKNASNACVGKPDGMEYNLTALTGGAPSKPVYVLPGDADGLIGVTLGGATSVTSVTSVAVAGRGIEGGASDNAIRMTLPRGGSTGTADGSGANPATTSCIGEACNDSHDTYIPGWGFTSDLKKTALQASTYHSPTTINGIYGNPAVGRVNWRQLNVETAP